MWGYIVQNLFTVTSPFGQINVTLHPPLQFCIHLPSGVVVPLSLYQTQRYNRLSNLCMALFVSIYFHISLIIIPHLLQLICLIYLGKSISHKHYIIYAYMYHISTWGGPVEYIHCNNSIKCYHIFIYGTTTILFILLQLHMSVTYESRSSDKIL